MKTTLSIIKADIGSIGGHIKPSQQLIGRVREFVQKNSKGLINDLYVSHTGDDIALLFSHQKGTGHEALHKMAWEAFVAGTETAKEQGLYGAGQDLLKDAFSGNVKGMGPAVAEMEFEERPNEPFLFFAADKTDPRAYNLPLFLAFADPMFCPGLILSPAMNQRFKLTIMDVEYTEGDRIIELNAPEDLYDIAALLRDNGGNHRRSLMPVRINSPVFYFDGSPIEPKHADAAEKRQQQAAESSPADSVRKAISALLMDVYNKHRNRLAELDPGLVLFSIALMCDRLKSFKNLALVALASLFVWAMRKYLPKKKEQR